MHPRHAMLRKALLKSEADAVIEAYNSPDTHNLPAGNTTWRFSNAISWIAGATEDAERKLDLMKIAGEVLPKAGSRWIFCWPASRQGNWCLNQ
jgi:hypothetical protein